MSRRCIVLLVLRDLLFTVLDETIEHRLDQAFFRGEMIQDPALAQFGLTRHRLHRQTHHAVAEHNTLRSSEDELDCLGCRFLAFHDAGTVPSGRYSCQCGNGGAVACAPACIFATSRRTRWRWAVLACSSAWSWWVRAS